MVSATSELRIPSVPELADGCLVLSHRLSEWMSNAPTMEEDVAMGNIALDLLGQARGLLQTLGDENELAYFREAQDFRNPVICELPNDDYGFTLLRQLLVDAWLSLVWPALAASADDERVRGVAEKAIKENAYHLRHSTAWVVRLGDGTDESRRRTVAALTELWRYTPELFESDAVDDAAQAGGLGPRWAELREPWLAEMKLVLDEAGLEPPAQTAFRSSGKLGRHSEHMGYILTDMQYLQRAFPGGVW
jgi:ring-1,2-phenylacetyl-CoA epoxidase subunit PaaC